MNKTVFAGKLSPIANVSVTNIIFIKSSVKSNSMSSFIVGIRPEWWTAIPFIRSYCVYNTYGSWRSSGSSWSIAAWNRSWTCCLYSCVKGLKRSCLLTKTAYSVHFYRDKVKIIAGSESVFKRFTAFKIVSYC